jgi:hypothetical protein
MSRITSIGSMVAVCGVAALSLACSERRSLVGPSLLGPSLVGPSLVGPSLVGIERPTVGLPSLAAQISPARLELGPMFSGAGAAFTGLSLPALADLGAQVAPAVPPPSPEVVHVPGAPESETACPAGMVLVDGESCTDVEHTCLKEMKDDPAHRCLEFKPGADVCVAPKGHLKFCMDRYEWPGTPGAQPRVLVDYFEAEKSCQSVGKRMCKEDEFYLACEGPEHWPYAWGHVRHPSPCNIDRPYFMVDWNKWAKGGHYMVEEAQRLDQALPIGSSKCWSPYGVHDIAGNVDEWTTARPGRELQGSLMGGYWGPVQNACRYVTTVHGPEFMFYQIGFRCCSEAKG